MSTSPNIRPLLRIGVSSCFIHADPLRQIFKGKTLLYLVQDVSDWLFANGIVSVLIPTIPSESLISHRDLVAELDGLILQGGADVAPESYGEKPLRPEWAGDFVRDQYEISLINEFLAQKKPILGLCRGLQLINVAFKGTLLQDIGTQMPVAQSHRDWNVYDKHFHMIQIEKKSKLSALYKEAIDAKSKPDAVEFDSHVFKVNSVHHQAIKELGAGLRAEAYSVPDRIVEAIRLEGDRYVVGVQWHPEFQNRNDLTLINTKPLIDEFIAEARRGRKI